MLCSLRPLRLFLTTFAVRILPDLCQTQPCDRKARKDLAKVAKKPSASRLKTPEQRVAFLGPSQSSRIRTSFAPLGRCRATNLNLYQGGVHARAESCPFLLVFAAAAAELRVTPRWR